MMYLFAITTNEVGGFLVQLPEQLLLDVESRLINFGIQYVGLAITQSVVGSRFPDSLSSAKVFVEGVDTLSTALTPEKAISRGSAALGILILSGFSAEDSSVSLTFAGFLAVLIERVLSPGSHLVFSRNLFKFYLVKNITVRLITEIGVERKRR
jgi:hypothetical protein